MLSFLYLLCVLPVIRNRLPIVAVVAELVDHNFQSVVFELELSEVFRRSPDDSVSGVKIFRELVAGGWRQAQVGGIGVPAFAFGVLLLLRSDVVQFVRQLVVLHYAQVLDVAVHVADVRDILAVVIHEATQHGYRTLDGGVDCARLVPTRTYARIVCFVEFYAIVVHLDARFRLT
jgi:hypothetical protein